MRRFRRLPYEPKKIITVGDTCCMRCNEYYNTQSYKNSIVIEDFWNYCSLKCALDDEIFFETFFAALESSDYDAEDKNQSFYDELSEVVRLHKDSIDIDMYIAKAKKFKAKKLLEILKSAKKTNR